MKDSTKDEIKGKAEELKGNLKQAAGHVAGDADLEAEGEAEKLEGKLRQAAGKVKKVIGQ